MDGGSWGVQLYIPTSQPASQPLGAVDKSLVSKISVIFHDYAPKSRGRHNTHHDRVSMVRHYWIKYDMNSALKYLTRSSKSDREQKNFGVLVSPGAL